MDEEMKDVDPISGNEVPLGAKPEEVRDDVPIMASEGEYVLPANVVRYIGLDRIEKMVKQAKKGLTELDAEGRIGGEKATMDEDLPFSPEELVAVDEAPAMMAEGGLVSENDMDIDPATGLPKWLVAMQQNQLAPPTPVATPAPTPAPTTSVMAPEAPKRGSEGGEKRNAQAAPVGLSKPVKDWSPEDYDKYSRFRTSPDAKIVQGFASLVPGGAFLSNVAQRNTERTVNQNLTEMLKSGKDLNGKPLSTEQLSTLRETYAKISGQPISKAPGFVGAAQAIARDTGLITPRAPTKEQVDRYNEKVQGNGLINRAIDFISGNKKPKTSPANDTSTTDLKEKGQQDRYGNTLVSGGRNKDSDRTVKTPGGKTVTTSTKPTNKSSTRTVTKKK